MSLEEQRVTWIGPIERGVPIPRSKRGHNVLRPRLKSMQIGDSFLTSYTNAAVHAMAKKVGVKLETRPEDGKMRVWRVA